MTTATPPQDIPPHVVAVEDYERLAKERLTEAAWAYISGGAADELTLRDNADAFRRLKLANRVFGEVAGGDTRVSLLGTALEHPILLAPVAHQRLAHPQGELATVLAASALKAGMIVSTEASYTLEDVAAHAQTPLWFQLYIQSDRGFTKALAQRAAAAGYRALCVTADAAVSGVRNREQRAAFALPPGLEPVNLREVERVPPPVARPGENAIFNSALLARAATWRDIEWLAAEIPLPILVKGVMTPADALRAAEHGAAGVIVSNHGGRTLDTVPATIDALPAVAHALGGRLPIVLDGGIRRGTDVLKALALGAAAVAIGRPYVYALAAAGAAGVAHVLHILRTELEMAMVLTGCRTIAAITPDVLWRPS